MGQCLDHSLPADGTLGPKGVGARPLRGIPTSHPGISSAGLNFGGLDEPRTSPWLFGEEAAVGQASQWPEVTSYLKQLPLPMSRGLAKGP